MKVAGFGFRSGATVADLRDVLALTGQTPDAVASISTKAQTPVLQRLAKELDVPLIALDENEIAGEQTLTCSPRIKARFGTGSLAEAAAQAGARTSVKGATVRLLSPRVITANGNATVAIAQATVKGRT
ncbi:cobalamin biosynthesis protein [Aliisedimentitalea scapharcae]|uniref:Cobalamin biosynthesis protein n=1 Tax=Aliisedimentitalea scapharcae TaxID=1524259 RepID=A0ABZ2XZ67_9RHOB